MTLTTRSELVGVLAKKFSRNREELAHVAVYLSEIAELVRPGRRLKVLDDEPDNRTIECAVTGRAAANITGDKAMLRLIGQGNTNHHTQ